MKRKAALIAACALAGTLVFSGCSYFPPVPSDWSFSPAGSSVSGTETVPTETKAPDPAEEAVKAYADFILGKNKVSSSGYLENNGNKPYLDLTNGSYNLDELKKALRFDAGAGSKAHYTVLDCGGDGVGELALSFDTLDHTEASVICIIGYKEGGLVLNALIEENTAGEYKLYESGYLKSDSMPSKGIYKMVLLKAEEGGKCKEVFTFGDYLGPAAAEIIKHADTTGRETIDGYESIPADFLIREYIADGKVLISVGRWSSSENEKSYEENFVSKLKTLGAEEISEARMTELSSVKDFTAKEVSWTDCTSEETASTSAGVANVAGKFTLTVYPNPEKIEYSNLGNVVYVLSSGEGTDMRFTSDSDDVNIILEKGSWDMNTDTFAPETEIFNIQSKIGTVYQFNCVPGDIFPYYKLRAVKGDYTAEWLILKSNENSVMVIRSAMKGTS